MYHKKIIICILLLLPSLLWAQQKERIPTLSHPSLHIGGSLGYVASQVLFMHSVTQSIASGARIGFVATMSNSEYVAFSMEVALSQRGWKETYSDNSSGRSYFRRLSFIDLPLLCHLYYPMNKLKAGVKMGPQIGLFIGENVNKSGDGFTQQDETRHALNVVNKFAWGLIGGPSLSYTFGKHDLELDIMLYYGFNDLFSTTVRDPYSKSSELFGIVKFNYLFRLL